MDAKNVTLHLRQYIKHKWCIKYITKNGKWRATITMPYSYQKKGLAVQLSDELTETNCKQFI